MKLEISDLYKSTSKIVHRLSSPILSLDINNTNICAKNLIPKFMSLLLDEKYIIHYNELVLILLNNSSKVNNEDYLKELRKNLKNLYEIYVNSNLNFGDKRSFADFWSKTNELINAIDLSGGFTGKIATTKDVFSNFESFLLTDFSDENLIDYFNDKGYDPMNDEKIFYSLLSISINDVANNVISQSLKSLSVISCDIDELIRNNDDVKKMLNIETNPAKKNVF